MAFIKEKLTMTFKLVHIYIFHLENLMNSAISIEIISKDSPLINIISNISYMLLKYSLKVSKDPIV